MQRPEVEADPSRSVPPATLLIVGVGLVFMTFMRYSIAGFGWVVFAPFLAFIYESGSLKRHLILLAVLAITFLLTVSKMNTWEIPFAPVPFFAAPLALSYFIAVAAAGFVYRRAGPRWGTYTFASMAVGLGWVQYTFTPGSSWGILAHTQLDNLPLVQLTSLTGVSGLTFLVALGSGVTAAAWSSGVKKVGADLAVLGLLVASALLYGQLRLGHPAPGGFVRVGAIVSPVTHHEFFAAYEDIDTLRPLDRELLARSVRAADMGARVVVWNEMATLVSVGGEDALTSRGKAFAMERQVLLLMAYGVVDSVQPFHFINKYRIYLPDGTLADEYIKRHPVPVDPNPKGTAHARAVAFEGVDFIGAICYDYGFPGIARDNAIDGGSLVLLPSSDWRGIDPEHGRMALMNAVAVGLPMVRPVRAATSIASDQYGRLLGSVGPDSASDGVMVVAVPTERVSTLYTRTGEILPVVALMFCALAFVHALRSPRETIVAVDSTNGWGHESLQSPEN